MKSISGFITRWVEQVCLIDYLMITRLLRCKRPKPGLLEGKITETQCTQIFIVKGQEDDASLTRRHREYLYRRGRGCGCSPQEIRCASGHTSAEHSYAL